jgi:hypothetical protein
MSLQNSPIPADYSRQLVDFDLSCSVPSWDSLSGVELEPQPATDMLIHTGIEDSKILWSAQQNVNTQQVGLMFPEIRSAAVLLRIGASVLQRCPSMPEVPTEKWSYFGHSKVLAMNIR